MEDEGAYAEILASWYGYSDPDPAFNYFNGPSSLEQASLYRALVEEGDPAAGFFLRHMHAYASEMTGDFESISSLLASLPSGEAGAALSSMGNQVSNIDLAGLDLTGWETTGKILRGVNLTGSNVTVAQLNGASDIRRANLSGTGITRADLEASGKWSASQLNSITY